METTLESTATFEHLVRTHEGRLRSFLAARHPDAARVDDLAQEAFIVALRKFGEYDPSRDFWPWIKAIALNLLRNDLRRSRETAELVDIEADELGEGDTVDALRLCLKELDGAAARMVEARYRDGHEIETIAASEDRSPKAVVVALVRIRQLLRECIERRLR